jgi:CRP/FNR family transcriptional regulator, putaive post-exponential-phase nitrogen-starvation regulator
MKNKQDEASILSYVQKYKINYFLSPELMDMLVLTCFKSGEYIIKNDEEMRNVYLFVEGKAKVYYSLTNGKSLLARFYTPFEFIGDVELFNYDRYICSMKALTPVKCLALSINLIKKNIETNSKLLVYICQSLGRKLARFNETSAVNLMVPLNQRLAEYFIAIFDEDPLSKQLVKEIQTENLSELADLLGTSYRQLTRVIKQFKDDNIIEKSGKTFKINNIEALKKLSLNIRA